jgi:hypothetical protein
MRTCLSFLLVIILVGCQQGTPDSSSFARSLNLGGLVKNAAPEKADWREDQSGQTKSRKPGAAEFEAHYQFRIRGEEEDVSEFITAVRDRLAADIQSAGGDVADSGESTNISYTIGNARGDIAFVSSFHADADYPHAVEVLVRETVGH